MARVVMDRQLAWAAATDAGNRAMRRGGRAAWSEKDYAAAVATFDRLWPVEKDLEVARAEFYGGSDSTGGRLA